MLRFIAGIVVGTVLTASGVAVAASAYVIVVKHDEEGVEITAAQAATGADWFIARGGWDGDRADTDYCALWRNRTVTPNKYLVYCDGRKTITNTELQKGDEVVETIP